MTSHTAFHEIFRQDSELKLHTEDHRSHRVQSRVREKGDTTESFNWLINSHQVRQALVTKQELLPQLMTLTLSKY